MKLSAVLLFCGLALVQGNDTGHRRGQIRGVKQSSSSERQPERSSRDGIAVKAPPQRTLKAAPKGQSDSTTTLDATTTPAPKRVIVKFKNDQGKADALDKASSVHKLLDDNIAVIDVDSASEFSLLSDSNVEYVEYDEQWEEMGFREDVDELPFDGRRLKETIPYGITMVQADQVTVGNTNVKVCMVDTGTDVTHQDLNKNKITGLNRQADITPQVMLYYNQDNRGHGTHVSGTVAAIIGNNLGVRGVGDIPLFVTRGLNDDGKAWQSDIVEAVGQCTQDKDVRVISLSLGGSGINTAMKDLLAKLNNQGYLIFAAAGNSGTTAKNYPAADPNVVSVAAVKDNRQYWPWSNYGSTLELSAPGYQVLSTVPGNQYAYYSGTSMATPHAAASAAILWSHHPECTNLQIRYALAYTADDVGVKGCDNDYGYGIVQVKNALDFLDKYGCDNTNWGQKPSTGECSTVDAEPVLSVQSVSTNAPTKAPTEKPTPKPTSPKPTKAPTHSPTEKPTPKPTSPKPTKGPTKAPTQSPSDAPTHTKVTAAPTTEFVTKYYCGTYDATLAAACQQGNSTLICTVGEECDGVNSGKMCQELTCRNG